MTRWPLWLAVIGAAVCAAGILGVVMTSPPTRAAEPAVDAPRWQIWIKRPGAEWEVYRTKRGETWVFGVSTSCTLDLASVSMVEPSGTALACLRIGTRMVQR